jgi:hypothetical protein
MTRNVVLICLDTVRQDFFTEHAPRLQSMADAVFEQCRAASGWSVPSHASMMTGTLPHQHGIHVYNRDFSGLRRADTFLGSMPEHHATGVSANAYASSAFGFDGMFDRYCDVSPQCRFPDGMNVIKFGRESTKHGVARYADFVRESIAHDHPVQSLANGGLVLVDRALTQAPIPKLLDDGASIISRYARSEVEQALEPFFLFMNYMDAHAPLTNVWGYDDNLHDASNTWTSKAFDTDEVNYEGRLDENLPELERYRGLYAAAIDYLDRKVTRLVQQIQSMTDEETTFVITADHGDHLGYEADDGLFGHRGPLTEGLLHVPLVVINGPDGWDPQTDEYVSHLQLGELVASLAHGEVPDLGRERIPAERIGSNVPDGVSLTDDQLDYWDRMVRCVYDGTRKFVWDSTGAREEFVLDRDRPCWQEKRRERIDIDAYEAEFFDDKLLAYKQRARREQRDTDVDVETQDRLEDLGYL